MPQNSSLLKKRAFPSILVIGDAGTQKTRFLAGCPRPYIMDFDYGLQSAREFDFDFDTFKDAPWTPSGVGTVDPERGIYPWGTAWNKIISRIDDEIYKEIHAKTWPYLTLGLDSLTTLANQSLNSVLKNAGKTGKANPEVQHWGQQLRNLEVLIEEIATWPVILVMTAHIKRDDNLVVGEKEFLPLVGGQFGSRVGIYFTDVYYTKVVGSGKDRKVTFMTEPQGLYKMAKSHYNVPNGTEAKWDAIAPYFGLQSLKAQSSADASLTAPEETV